MQNSAFHLIFFILSLFLILSCSQVEPLKLDDKPENTHSQLQDISFSISINSDVGPLIALNKEELVVRVKRHLRESGKYAKIIYTPLERETKPHPHLHFQLVITRTKRSDQPVITSVSELSLLIIPEAITYYTDFSMFLLIEDKEVFSTSTSDKFNSLNWLPLIVLNPIINDFIIARIVLRSQLEILFKEFDHEVLNVH